MTSELTRKEKFKRRFDRYYANLCREAFRYIPDRDECEDIVQETFISMWNNEKDALPENEFAAYMVSSVKNRCISFLRKRRIDTVSMDDGAISLSMNHLDDTDDDEEQTKDETREKALEDALSMLPPKCREVFLLSKLRGMKYREIAEETGISEKTVENHMGKAIRILREYVAAHPDLLAIVTIMIQLMINIKR